ncbi:acyl-CoA synthetase family member 4 [Elysia marginata]|uniref:Acyl-CoA synthetase family member 4 n=1 Tax=Elysia marginata TaxID=1093978 RepID=A0AAV4J5Q1_9GAST|nr:acyl-CoA synthetase family member 4 [Elysia marginata]
MVITGELGKLKSEFSKLGVKNTIVGLFLTEDSFLPAVLLGLLSNDCSFFPLSVSGKKHVVKSLSAVAVSHVVTDNYYFKDLISILGHGQCKTLKILQGFGLRLLSIKQKLEETGSPSSKHDKSVLDGLAYCITTSGTTSEPKVVRVPHGCILPNIRHLSQIFQLRQGDKMLMTSPLTFDPSIIDIFCTLSSGACLVMVPTKVKQAPEKLLEVIHKRQSITVMQATPSLMRTFGPDRLRHTILGPDSNLRLLTLGGEQFPRAPELRLWLDPTNKTQLYNLYGVTEVSCWASCQQVDKHSLLLHDKPVPIGAALDETEIKLSPLSTERVPDDVAINPGQEIGEIIIGSSTRVCIIDDEQVKKSAHSHVVWRQTGDVGTLGADTNIYCLGRVDDQVKRLGKRLNLAAVELVMEELPEVLSCCAVHHQTTLAVFVILRPKSFSSDLSIQHSGACAEVFISESLAADTFPTAPHSGSEWSTMVTKLQDHAKHALPSHAVPDVFIEVEDNFPLTLHGAFICFVSISYDFFKMLIHALFNA